MRRAADHRRHRSTESHLVAAGARSVLISVRVAANKSQQRNVVDVGALLMIETHLARYSQRQKAGSQSLALWLAHTDIRANRQRRNKLGQLHREARRFQLALPRRNRRTCALKSSRFSILLTCPAPGITRSSDPGIAA